MAAWSWSLSSEFSFQCNPSSVWSYGLKPAGYYVSGTYILFTQLNHPFSDSGIVAWYNYSSEHMLGVYYNIKPTTITVDSGIRFGANDVAMHPGSDGRFSVVRFTAPKDGNYILDAMFTHIESCALHSGVYIVHNDFGTLWEIDLYGPGDSKSFRSTDSGVFIRENEHIDFIVGVGLDNKYVCDMTLARVNIYLLKNETDVYITGGSIGFVLGFIISAILFYVYYKSGRNINRPPNTFVNTYGSSN